MSHTGEDSDGFLFEMDEQMSPPNITSSTEIVKSAVAFPTGHRPDLVDSTGKVVVPSGRAILASSEGATAFAKSTPSNPGPLVALLIFSHVCCCFRCHFPQPISHFP